MAAGLSIRADRVDAFRERLNACARAALTPEELGPTQRVDVVLTLAEINDELEQWSRRLEPCGMGNPGPVFGVRAVQLLGSRVVGRNHLKTSLTSGSRSLDAIAFNWADRVAAWGDGPMDAAVRLERNEWNGRSALQARAVALGPSQR
jgi:single-stranded-DNA-specific exonuclease